MRAGTIKELERRPEDAQGARRLRDHQGGLRLAAQGRHLRVAPAVADRRVLHRLQARHAPGEARQRRDDPRRADDVDDPASTSSTTCCGARTASGWGSSSTSSAPASPAARRTSTRSSAAPARRCARPTRVLAKLADQNQTLKQLDHRRGHDDRRPRRQQAATSAAGSSRPRRPPPPRPSAATTSPPACSACPTFLRELRPTMAALGDASEAQTPALQNLNASADQLATFLENLEPLSESTQVNLRSLAEASRKGRPAVKAAQPRRRRARRGHREGARAGQQRRDRLRAPQRPQERRREGPALTGRPGLHGLRGRPAVGLRPVAGDQHLRQERLHPQGQPLPLQVQRTTRTRSR